MGLDVLVNAAAIADKMAPFAIILLVVVEKAVRLDGKVSYVTQVL